MLDKRACVDYAAPREPFAWYRFSGGRLAALCAPGDEDGRLYQVPRCQFPALAKESQGLNNLLLAGRFASEFAEDAKTF
jgi:hypothetical protein